MTPCDHTSETHDSRWRCEYCFSIHGSRPNNGAVDWGCYEHPQCSRARQVYIGYLCSRCNTLVYATTKQRGHQAL